MFLVVTFCYSYTLFISVVHLADSSSLIFMSKVIVKCVQTCLSSLIFSTLGWLFSIISCTIAKICLCTVSNVEISKKLHFLSRLQLKFLKCMMFSIKKKKKLKLFKLRLFFIVLSKTIYFLTLFNTLKREKIWHSTKFHRTFGAKVHFTYLLTIHFCWVIIIKKNHNDIEEGVEK